MTPKKVKKLANYVQDKDLSFYDELNELNENLEKVEKVIEESIPRLFVDQIAQFKGADGRDGRDGKDGRDGVDGRDGQDAVVDYRKIIGEVLEEIPTPKDGKDGRDGYSPIPGVDFPLPKDGLDGSILTPEQIRDSLSSLVEDERLSADAVRGLPTFEEIVKRLKKDKSLTALDLKDGHSIVYPNKNVQDQRWHGSGVSKAIAGSNITITSENPDTPGMGVITISATSTGAQTVSNETPTGAVDGVNTVFTTALHFVAGTTRLYLNGLRQRLGGGFDYTETASNEITFVSAPQTGDFLIIDYDTL